MVRPRWEEFVAGTAPASRGGPWSNHGMTHEARACMARYRQVHGATYDNLSLLFLVSPPTAKKACDDIMMYCLMMDPWQSAPTMLNRVLTGEQVKQLTLHQCCVFFKRAQVCKKKGRKTVTFNAKKQVKNGREEY